jgi:glutathione S-transferase
MKMQAPFRPVLYLKEGCPHCFKLRLFLLEARLADRFEAREFAPGDAREQPIRAELASHFEKVTFPAVQVAPGKYLNESDDIIRRYASEEGVDPALLPLFRAYADGLQPRLHRLSRENKALKQRLEEDRSGAEAASNAMPA